MRRLAFLSLIALSACSVLDYRTVQDQFERAAQTDNERAVSPFTDAIPSSEYARVLEKLTPAYIGKLEPRLHANAWMLRGFSAWRTGDYATAGVSSSSGLDTKPPPGAGSRDEVLLTLLPALATESGVADTWRDTTTKTEAGYDALKTQMKDAWEVLVVAEGKLAKATPASTRFYLYYQKWRISLNWAQMINDAADGDFTKVGTMSEWAKSEGGVGVVPGTAATEAAAKVKGQLADLIAALSAK